MAAHPCAQDSAPPSPRQRGTQPAEPAGWGGESRARQRTRVRDARATRPAPRIGPHPIRPSAAFPGAAGEGAPFSAPAGKVVGGADRIGWGKQSAIAASCGDARATRPAPRIGPHPIRPSATFPGAAGEGLIAAASWAPVGSPRRRCAQAGAAALGSGGRSSRLSTGEAGRARPVSRVKGLDRETPHRAGAVIPKGPERGAEAPQAFDGDGAMGLPRAEPGI